MSEEAFREWWENHIYKGDLCEMAREAYLAATQRAAGIFEDILTQVREIVDDNCYCKDWDREGQWAKEMCPYCGIEDIINAQRIVKQALKQND
jgi:hypothetical protein